MALAALPQKILDHLHKPFINEEGAKNVRNYDYHGEDHSQVVKYLQPFWNKCATFIPPHVSPNVVTMMGYSIALFGCILSVNFGRDNPWIFGLYGVLLFCYQTFDALDGLQGRKVGMYTNATTEVFDHGCDSNVTIMTTLAAIYAFDIAGTWQSVIFMLGTLSAFFFLTWENTTTKKMIFRAGLLNPTDSLICTELTFLITAFFPNLWSTPFYKLAFMSAAPSNTILNLLLTQTLGKCITYGSIMTALSAMKLSTTSVMDFWKRKHDRKELAPNVLRDFMKSCTVLMPIILLNVVGALWMVFGESRALVSYPVLSLLSMATPWAYSILRLIVSEITYQDIDIKGMALTQIPLLLPLLATWLPYCAGAEIPLMFLSVACYVPLYAWTTNRVVGDTCSALNMAHFWTIPPQPPKDKEGSVYESVGKGSGKSTH